MKMHIIDKKLLNSQHRLRVLLVGAGGNGSQMLAHLARMDNNLREIGANGLWVTTWDGDTIEPHNVGRQLFSPIDIGENKAIILTERINRHYGVDWFAMDEYLTEDDNLGGFDIVISAVDSAKARKIVRDKIGKKTYWLDMGKGNDRGQVVLGGHGLPNIFDIHPDMNDEDEEDDTPSCSTIEALEKQDLMVNTIISAYASQILWTLLKTTRIKYHGAYINLETMKTTPIPV